MVFHLDKSGKVFNFEQLKNNFFISITFDIFHLDISGNDINEEQLKNNKLIFIILSI